MGPLRWNTTKFRIQFMRGLTTILLAGGLGVEDRQNGFR
jgi:hypothetical protein